MLATMEPLVFEPGGGPGRAAAKLEIARVIEAPRERVWHAFVDPVTFKTWWRPPGFTCPLAELDPRVGGAYRVHMRSPQGVLHSFGGTYRAVEAPEHLAFSWTFGEGQYKGLETSVELRFAELGAATEVTLLQEPFPIERMKNDFDGGWTNCLSNLADLLEGGAG